jgi:hypothetical protein
VNIRYPAWDDWKALLDSPAQWNGPPDTAFVGTIADLLQLAEDCKKHGGAGDLAAFKVRCRALLSGAIVQAGILHLRELDQETLVNALFDVDFGHGGAGVRYWSEVDTKDIRPWRTLRRLVLRPLHQWFEDEPYRQMEAFFGEEPQRNG